MKNIILFKKQAIFIIVPTIVVAILFFILTNSLLPNAVEAQESLSLSDNKSLFVSSTKEASELAGFDVATPDPNLMTAKYSDGKYSIDVNQLVQLGTKPAPKFVGQSWEFNDGTVIRFIQAPGLQLPNIGEKISIGGTIGERVYFEADSHLPPRVALYWQSGDMGYSLFGTLTERVTEGDLISIANSISKN